MPLSGQCCARESWASHLPHRAGRGPPRRNAGLERPWAVRHLPGILEEKVIKIVLASESREVTKENKVAICPSEQSTMEIADSWSSLKVKVLLGINVSVQDFRNVQILMMKEEQVSLFPRIACTVLLWSPCLGAWLAGQYKGSSGFGTCCCGSAIVSSGIITTTTFAHP